MDFALDTEFDGFGGNLLSLALAPADKSLPCFYVVIEHNEPLTDWVALNVAPHLPKVPEGIAIVGSTEPVSRERAARLFANYLRTMSPDEKPVLIADWPEDFAQVLNMLITGPGTMVNTPDFLCDYRALHGFNTADHSSIPHNALASVRPNRSSSRF